MRRRLVVILALIVVGPLITLGWLGAKVVRDERQMLRHRLDELLAARLDDLDRDIATLLEERRRELEALTRVSSTDPATLRRLVRGAPRVRQVFVLGADGELDFPSPSLPLTADEQEFLLRTRQLWTKRDLFERPAETPAVVAPPPAANEPLSARSIAAPQVQQELVAQQVASGFARGEGTAKRSTSGQDTAAQSAGGEGTAVEDTGGEHKGWYVWFVEDDVGLIYWRRDESGRVLGAELDRVRLLSDLVAALPATSAAGASGDRVVLADARGSAVYQWGTYEPPNDEAPAVERALRWPLSAWKLRTFVSPAQRLEAGGVLAGGVFIGAGVGIAALIIALGIYFYRESTRDLVRAAQRVSFVNNVSHELKTPLTNIRMYAELLAQDLTGSELGDDQDGDGDAAGATGPRARKRLGIIVAESQRLSRLIGNVLTFARQGKGTLTLRTAPAVLDEVIEEVVEQFRPALERRGITTELHLDARTPARIDRDVVDQIVANLVSNAEKYAPGGPLRIDTAQDGERATVVVHDSGPGIPMGQGARAFAPFSRLDDRVTEGVAGTGIGLGLARDLARLHGGDLELVPSEAGARLRLTLHAPVS